MLPASDRNKSFHLEEETASTPGHSPQNLTFRGVRRIKVGRTYQMIDTDVGTSSSQPMVVDDIIIMMILLSTPGIVINFQGNLRSRKFRGHHNPHRVQWPWRSL
jgi:hypothetical protein